MLFRYSHRLPRQLAQESNFSLSVAWFMNWVRKHGFVPFAIYRIVVGAAVLYWVSHIMR